MILDQVHLHHLRGAPDGVRDVVGGDGERAGDALAFPVDVEARLLVEVALLGGRGERLQSNSKSNTLDQMSSSDPGLVETLRALPAQTSVNYAPAARIALQTPGISADALRAVATDRTQTVLLRFNAFYCMQALAWRQKNYSLHRSNTDEFQSEFADQPMFDFLQAEYYSALDHEVANLETSLIYAEQAADKLPGIPGIHHLYAELICRYVEREGTRDAQLLSKADRHVARAIALTNSQYPKYFATRALVSMHRGAYIDAMQQVSIAIDREDSNGTDYAIRVGDYQLIRSRISYAVEYAQLKSSQEDAINEFRQMRSQVLGVLGLLAAVIALIASSSNIAAARPDGAIPILIVCGATILVVFWGFHFLFIGGRKGLQGYIPLIVGLSLGIIGAVWSALS